MENCKLKNVLKIIQGAFEDVKKGLNLTIVCKSVMTIAITTNTLILINSSEQRIENNWFGFNATII